MNVIAVCDVILIGNALYDAKALLEALGKLVGGGLERSSVDTVVDVFLVLPLSAVFIELAHYLKSKLLALRLGELLADKAVNALPETCIAEGNSGISVVKQPVYLLALFQSGKSAVLPEDRRNIGKSTLETFMAASECSVAKIHSFVEYRPELVHILACAESDIYQIDGNNALIEASVIFMLAFLVVSCICKVALLVRTVGGKE